MHTLGRNVWLTAATLAALAPAGAVLAADLPVKALPVAPVAFYDWSGVYVGVHAGYGGGMKSWSGEFSNDFAVRGFLGGGQVGINKQIASLVFGLELDGSWANIDRSQTFVVGGPVVGAQHSLTTTSKIDSLVMLTGRAGLAADRWFVYAKGGLAVAHETHSLSFDAFTIPLVPGGSASLAASGSESRWAPVVGFGTEYALGNNWSVKAEYNYIHLGSRTITLNGAQTTAGVTTPGTVDMAIEQAIHVAKVGVNYRFGGIQAASTFAPVPAAPGYNWSGAYIGAQAGYGVGHKEWSDFAGLPGTPDAGRYDVNGWLAGATVGVNAQAGSFVFGVEGEWMWTGIRGGRTSFIDNGAGTTETLGLESKVNWLAIAAARAGFVAYDRLLVYGKAGVALADETHTLAANITSPGGSVTENTTAKAFHTGLAVGAGAEYALGGNWSAKIEYDYIKMLGQFSTGTGVAALNLLPLVGSIAIAQPFDRIQQDLHIIKLGVNYHFNPAPVVVSARY